MSVTVAVLSHLLLLLSFYLPVSPSPPPLPRLPAFPPTNSRPKSLGLVAVTVSFLPDIINQDVASWLTRISRECTLQPDGMNCCEDTDTDTDTSAAHPEARSVTGLYTPYLGTRGTYYLS